MRQSRVSRQRRFDAQHRQLTDVSRRALDAEVDRLTLGLRAHRRRRVSDVSERAATLEERAQVRAGASLADALTRERADAGKRHCNT